MPTAASQAPQARPDHPSELYCTFYTNVAIRGYIRWLEDQFTDKQRQFHNTDKSLIEQWR